MREKCKKARLVRELGELSFSRISVTGWGSYLSGSFGWETRIRTWIYGVRVRCPTIERSPSSFRLWFYFVNPDQKAFFPTDLWRLRMSSGSWNHSWRHPGRLIPLKPLIINKNFSLIIIGNNTARFLHPSRKETSPPDPSSLKSYCCKKLLNLLYT